MPKEQRFIHFSYWPKNRYAVCGMGGPGVWLSSVAGEVTCLKCIRAIELADLQRTAGYTRKP
jgi:hypothetical protein